MQSTEDGLDILFFSRGRGKGHAIPDMSIMDAFHALENRITYKFASYGTGAATFVEFGHSIVDLRLPDDNSFVETVVRTCEAIQQFSPHLVISHEEFAAVLSAKVMGIPSLFITDWFIDENHLWMQVLTHSSVVLFLGEQGVFDEPSHVHGKVLYLGPFLRKLKYSRADKDTARRELEIADNATVISVLPGFWANEQRAPIASLLIPAFRALNKRGKLLYWVAGEDCENLRKTTEDDHNVRLVRQSWPIERLMVASDLVITKGNRVTLMEVSALGVPSISLSHGLNPVEDFVVPRIISNLPLRVKGLTLKFLTDCIERALESPEGAKNSLNSESRGYCSAAGIAKVLLQQVMNHLPIDKCLLHWSNSLEQHT